MANALAAGVIRTRLAVANGDVQDALAGLDRRLTALNQRIARIDARIAALDSRIGAGGGDALRAQRDGAVSDAAATVQQRAVIEPDRLNLLSTDAVRHKPCGDQRGHRADGRRFLARLPDMILGALLGLVLGIGLRRARDVPLRS